MSRIAKLSAVVLAAVSIQASTVDSRTLRHAFDIKSGRLSDALIAVSVQARVTVLARLDQVDAWRAPGLKGSFTTREALERLTGAAGLTISEIGDAYVVRPAAPAAAPTVDADDPFPVEAVIVTGFGAFNAAAIQHKLDAHGVADGVDQDTTTLLPDLSVSNIARRIPGLASIPRDGASTSRQIEDSQSIVIRGLGASFVQVSLDGAPIASANQTNRAMNLALVPPTAIARIIALKTLTADMDPHGLSGRLELRTPDALAVRRPEISGRVSTGTNSTAGKGVSDQPANLRADLLAVSPLGSGGRAAGALALSYERFSSTSKDSRPGGESGTYLFYTANPASDDRVDRFADSSGYPTARRNQLYVFENRQERASALAKLEFASDVADISVLGAFIGQREEETRYEHLALADESHRPLSQTATSGVWTAGSVQTGYANQPERTGTALISARAEKAEADGWSWRASGALSRSAVNELRRMSKFTTSISGDTSFSYDLSSGEPRLRFSNPEAASDPSRSSQDYIREWTNKTRQTLAFADAAVGWNAKDGDHGLGVSAGVALTKLEQVFDREYIEGAVFDVSGCGESVITACDVVDLSGYLQAKTFATTDSRVPFYVIDDAKLRAAWNAQGRPQTTDRTDDSIANDYRLRETIRAGYVMGRYQDARLDVTFGLRYDQTHDKARLHQRDLSITPRVNEAEAFVEIERRYAYGFVLPSLIADYRLNDGLVLRGAYTRTVGRPNIDDLTTGETIAVEGDGRLAISRGNPDLKPLVSDNLDFSVEYYFDDRRSLASAAFFYKSVRDLIFSRRIEVSGYEYEGALYDATITQPTNASDASLYGVELALKKDFRQAGSIWKGLVLDANVTLTDSRFSYVNLKGETRNPGGWLNQPKITYNLQASYERGRLGAKLAYNYVGSYLSNILSDEGDLYDVYARARGVVDMQVRLNLAPQLTLIAEVENLGAAPLIFDRRFPTTGDLLATRAQRGRVLWLGMRWKLR